MRKRRYALDGGNFCLHFPVTLRTGRKTRHHLNYVLLENFLSYKAWICKVHMFQAMSFVLGFLLEASASNFDRIIGYLAFLCLSWFVK